MILLVTSSNDRTADRVVAELHRRDAEVRRFDTGDFPLSVCAHAELFETGWHGEIVTADGRVTFEDVTSIYYRRPTSFVFPPQLEGSDLVFATAEARRGLGGLLFALNARWVNHPSKVADAEFKPVQLAVAARCGLPVPRTAVTSDPDRARSFCNDAGGGVLYKPLSAANIVTTDGVRLVYSTHVDNAQVAADDDFSVTMNMLQKWVPKLFDVRVTVIGDDMFGVKIIANSADAHVDWRADYDSLGYEVIDIPVYIREGIRRYLSYFSLLFGAFDFSVTAHDWFFLECNANGQFGWLEAETGLPMSAAMADLLISVMP